MKAAGTGSAWLPGPPWAAPALRASARCSEWCWVQTHGTAGVMGATVRVITRAGLTSPGALNWCRSYSASYGSGGVGRTLADLGLD